MVLIDESIGAFSLKLSDKLTDVNLFVWNLFPRVVVSDDFVSIIHINFLIDSSVSEQLSNVGITFVIDSCLHEVSVIRFYTVFFNQKLDDLWLLVRPVTCHLNRISVF